MTTQISDIEEALQDSVFNDASVTDVIPAASIFPYALTDDDEFHNTIQYVVTLKESDSEVGGNGTLRQDFTIEIIATRDEDESIENTQALRDLAIAIVRLIRANLGKTWGGLVNYWRGPEDAPAVQSVVIDQDIYLQTRIKLTAIKYA